MLCPALQLQASCERVSFWLRVAFVASRHEVSLDFCERIPRNPCKAEVLTRCRWLCRMLGCDLSSDVSYSSLAVPSAFCNMTPAVRPTLTLLSCGEVVHSCPQAGYQCGSCCCTVILELCLLSCRFLSRGQEIRGEKPLILPVTSR